MSPDGSRSLACQPPVPSACSPGQCPGHGWGSAGWGLATLARGAPPHPRTPPPRLMRDGLCPELTSGFLVPTPAQWAASRPQCSGPALTPTQGVTEGVRGLPWGWTLETQKLGRVMGYRAKGKARTSRPTSTPLWGPVSESLHCTHARACTHPTCVGVMGGAGGFVGRGWSAPWRLRPQVRPSHTCCGQLVGKCA